LTFASTRRERRLRPETGGNPLLVLQERREAGGGKDVRWDWEMYGASALVSVKLVDPNARIIVEWGDPPRTVEWLFAPRADDTTLVSISERGFRGDDHEVVAQAIDSMGGFTMVLAGLKALLEQDVVLDLVADHHPDAHTKQRA
jgi:uncharacterized protein YndB with AHSA1/START domain